MSTLGMAKLLIWLANPDSDGTGWEVWRHKVGVGLRPPVRPDATGTPLSPEGRYRPAPRSPPPPRGAGLLFGRFHSVSAAAIWRCEVELKPADVCQRIAIELSTASPDAEHRHYPHWRCSFDSRAWA